MRRIAIAIAVLVAVVALAFTVPRLIPAGFVADRIAEQLASLTGRAVTLGGKPTLSLYPQVTVSVDKVAIADADGAGKGGEPFIEVGRLTARLKLLPLFIGQFRFDALELMAPRVHLVVNANGGNNWGLDRSLMARMAADETNDDASLRTAPTSLSISDGTILYDDLSTATRQELSGVNLEAARDTASGAASGSGAAKWRDETIEFNLLAAAPVDLVRGRPTGLRFAIASTLVRASFAGRFIGGAAPRFDGTGAISSPSLRRAIEWLGTPIGTGAILGAASAEGGIAWTGKTLSFSDARIELDGNGARGSLEATLTGARPAIKATLAADSLDLSAYLEASRADLNANGSWLLAPARIAFAPAIDAQVRLAADEIIAGAVRVGKATLSAGLKDGMATLAIGDAQFYGGTLALDVAAQNSEEGLDVRANLDIGGAPAGVVLADIGGITALDWSATASISLTGRGKSWGELLRSVTGKGDIAVVNGMLSGFDLAAAGATLADPLADPIPAGDARSDFSTLGAMITLHEGTITTGDLTMTSPKFSLRLAGSGSLFGGTVASEGILRAGGEAVPIGLDGSWQAPVLTRRDDPRAGRRTTEAGP